jgi:hypothetical protein
MTINQSNFDNTHRPWQLVLLLPNAQHHTIAHFRNRQDADDHLRAIQRLARNSQFQVLFVPPDDSAHSDS